MLCLILLVLDASVDCLKDPCLKECNFAYDKCQLKNDKNVPGLFGCLGTYRTCKLECKTKLNLLHKKLLNIWKKS